MNKTTNVFITGGLGSLGRPIVREFSKTGEHRIYSIDRKVPEENEQSDANIRYLNCDVTDYDSAERLFQGLKIDAAEQNVLINFAGLIYNEPIVRLDSGDFKAHSELGWKHCISGNLDTTFNATVHFIKFLVENRFKGLVINASSITKRGNPGQLAYSTAKAALSGFTNTVGKEMGPFGIRSVSLELGYFDVASTEKSIPKLKQKSLRVKNPMGRLGAPTDIFKAIISIIDNDYLNATTISLDGGHLHE